MIETPGRVGRLGRDERRAAIVAATIPLLVEHGPGVTTRQIAAAAGVAEGTLFRVFADKGELLRAAMIAALDPEPTAAALRAVSAGRSLREVLAGIVAILVDRQGIAVRVLMAAHQVRDHPHPGDIRGHVTQVVLGALTERLGVFAGELRLAPAQAARVLFSIVFGNALPTAPSGGTLGVEDIVDVLLHGVARDQRPGTATDSSG